MEYRTFRVEMGRMALIYGEQPPERLREYWETLKGMADAAFARACAAYKRQPGAIRFPYPADLSLLAAETAGSAAHTRALPPGAYVEAARFAQAAAARHDASHPPDAAALARIAHWDAKIADMLARRATRESGSAGAGEEAPTPRAARQTRS